MSVREICKGIVLRPYMPIILKDATIELTQRCDSKCLSCNTWKMPNVSLSGSGQRKQELSFEEHAKIIDEIKELGCQTIQLHGGEPLLYPRLPELIKYCSRNNILCYFATNGLKMTAKLADELVRSGIEQIRFSLDGPKEVHNKLRGLPDAFDRQINAIKMLFAADKNNRVNKTIRSNISSVNLKSIDKVIDIAKSLGITWIQFAFHSIYSNEMCNEVNKIFGEEVLSLRTVVPRDLLPQDVKLIRTKREQMIKKAKKYGIFLQKTRFFTLPAREIPKGVKRDSSSPCLLPYFNAHIDAFGDVIACENIRFPFGNVRQNSLKEIYQSGRYEVFTQIYSENYKNLKACDYCCNFL